MTEKEKWAKKILPYIDDLPRARELANAIASYVDGSESYTKAQIGSVIDNFYGKSCGLSIADDIDCLWRNS